MIEIGKIRNVGVVGHGGVGKTSLVEALLFAAGATTRLGKVDDGTTTTDFDPDEIKRKISLNTAVAFCDYKGHRLNLVDTPGYGDFVADARAGLRVVSAAVVVVDAVSGAQVQTEQVWKFANDYALPRVVVINRLDRERAVFVRALDGVPGHARAGPGRLGHAGDRHPASPRPDHQGVPVARRSGGRRGRGREDEGSGQAVARSEGAAVGARLQDDLGSPRRQALAL